jgi:CheY-like chemotaxis protein
MKILIADDDLFYRRLPQATLRQWGHEPCLAADGEEAWQELLQEELAARLGVGIRVLGLQQQLALRVRELTEAAARVKQLQGLLPICCYCKSVRDDQNYWRRVEDYLRAHSDLRFSHGICPDCYQQVVQPQLAAAATPARSQEPGVRGPESGA